MKIIDERFVIANIDATAGLTTLENLELKEKYEKMSYLTFFENFLLDTLENTYVSIKNRNFGYDKDILENNLIAFLNLIYKEKKTKLDQTRLSDLIFYVSTEEPLPLIIVYDRETTFGGKPALLIPPKTKEVG